MTKEFSILNVLSFDWLRHQYWPPIQTLFTVNHFNSVDIFENERLFFNDKSTKGIGCKSKLFGDFSLYSTSLPLKSTEILSNLVMGNHGNRGNMAALGHDYSRLLCLPTRMTPTASTRGSTESRPSHCVDNHTLSHRTNREIVGKFISPNLLILTASSVTKIYFFQYDLNLHWF